jgi:hypothetical protein
MHVLLGTTVPARLRMISSAWTPRKKYVNLDK